MKNCETCKWKRAHGGGGLGWYCANPETGINWLPCIRSHEYWTATNEEVEDKELQIKFEQKGW